MKVYEFMTAKIEFIDADDSIYSAIEKMIDRRIRSLVVRFNGKKTEYGVITAQDVVFKALARGINPTNTKISQIASRPLIIVAQDTSISVAASMLEKYDIARVFVTNENEIVGVISLMDIMDAALIMRARGDHALE